MSTLELKNWLTFCKERFGLAEHALMIACFTLGNAVVAAHLREFHFSWSSIFVAYAVSFSFFFRLRLFDEIKDYEFDLEHNPERPLARGLISVAKVKKLIYALTALEIVVVGLVASYAAVYHLLAIAYSYLMYREFFIGSLIRPHLTTYAMMHTLVSAFVGLSIAAITTGIETASTGLLLMGLANWAQFNLFEFARKTFAPSEEKPRVDSYSSLFKPLGAGLLSLSQILLGLFALYSIEGMQEAAMTNLAIALVLSLFLIRYAFLKTEASAKLFRNTTSFYLLIFYVVIIVHEVL